MHQSQLISKIPHILKEMYDADLLEEEVILGWAEKVRGSILHTIPAKYLTGILCLVSPLHNSLCRCLQTANLT